MAPTALVDYGPAAPGGSTLSGKQALLWEAKKARAAGGNFALRHKQRRVAAVPPGSTEGFTASAGLLARRSTAGAQGKAAGGGRKPRARAGAVLIALHNLDCSGANAVPLNLLQELARRSPGLRFVVHSPAPGPFAERFLEAGAEVATGDLDSLERRLRAVGDLRGAVCNSILSAGTVLRLEALGVPCLWTLHEWWPGAQLDEEIRRRNNKACTPETVREALAACSHVVCVSELQRQLYKPAAPSSVVYVGAADPREEAVSGDSRLARLAAVAEKRAPFTFLVLGIVCPRKNQLWAVQLFQQLCEQEGLSERDARMVVVGVRRSRAYEAEYADAVEAAAGDDPRIEVHPVTSEPERFLERADALVLLSKNEVTPCVISEAMAHGIPVVSTGIGGIPEMVRDGREGFLVDDGDDAAGVAALRALVRDPARCREMGRRGRATYEAKFSLGAMAKAYDGLMAATGPPRRPTVLVDMDGVLVDWDRGFAASWGGRSAIDRSASYKMEDCVPEELREEALELYHAEGFFAGLPAKPGAVQALREMVQSHVQVLLITSPVLSSRFCAGEKYQWVATHLGPEWLERLVLTSDKTLVRGDLLIDDKPRVGGQERLPSWEHVVFDAPYNRDTAHKLRLGDWAGWRGVMPWELAQGAGRAD